MRIERRLSADTDIVAHLLSLSLRKRRRAIELMGEIERDALDRAWPDWAHKGQALPPSCPDGSDWRTWVIMAGRGFGKTLAGSQWIVSAIAASSSPSRSRGELSP